MSTPAVPGSPDPPTAREPGDPEAMSVSVMREAVNRASGTTDPLELDQLVVNHPQVVVLRAVASNPHARAVTLSQLSRYRGPGWAQVVRATALNNSTDLGAVAALATDSDVVDAVQLLDRRLELMTHPDSGSPVVPAQDLALARLTAIRMRAEPDVAGSVLRILGRARELSPTQRLLLDDLCDELPGTTSPDTLLDMCLDTTATRAPVPQSYPDTPTSNTRHT